MASDIPNRTEFELDDLTVWTWGDPSAPLALCLHGYPDTAWTWRHLGPVLAEHGYYVVAPFSRGYAPTSVPADGDLTVGARIADALAIAEAGRCPALSDRPGTTGVRSQPMRAHCPIRRSTRAYRPGHPPLASIQITPAGVRAAGGTAVAQTRKQLVHRRQPVATAARARVRVDDRIAVAGWAGMTPPWTSRTWPRRRRANRAAIVGYRQMVRPRRVRPSPAN